MDRISINNKEIELLAARGKLRCEHGDAEGTPLLIPRPPDWEGNEELLMDCQVRVLGEDGMRLHYIELLRSALDLCEFWKQNVGNNTDWPIMVLSEGPHGVQELDARMRRLSMTSGCLQEVM